MIQLPTLSQTPDSLAGHRYVLREDHPYCIKCYENVFANNCDECNKIIGIDSKVGPVSQNSRFYPRCLRHSLPQFCRDIALFL